jgi:DNA (cytosine-5)-methyltransferase 3A
MIVLSLFDGMSCGLVALKRAGIPVTKYYASEIDKYAIQVSTKNHPEIIQLGDVTKWRDWDIETPDLIIGGSPCQGFSFAGKQLAFNDPRSALFFTMMDIIEYYKPRFKMLENVRMKKEYLDVITSYMGVEPVCINSALVSAQNRVRYYWANWKITQPEDRGILLKDILENEIVEGIKITGGAMRGRYLIDGVRQDHKMKTAGLTTQRLELREDGKSNTVTTVSKDVLACIQVGKIGEGGQGNRIYSLEGKSPSLIAQSGGKAGPANCCIQVGTALDINGHDSIKRIYSPEGKSPTLTANSGGNQEKKVAIDEVFYRKLTPIECERLMGLEDNYTEGVSNSQRYKMCGNGWETNTVTHNFKCLKDIKE